MEWEVPGLGEKITKEGPVRYNEAEDQFYFEDKPLYIYDYFLITTNGKRD